MPSIEAGMRELSAKLSDELPRQIARFREAFPKFRCGEPVYFLYSAGAFDGGTRDVSGKEALMFGLDVIARLKEPLSPLFAHELFHVYHAERIPKSPEAFYWNMWEEGLASYVSDRLNPGEPACCLPPAAPVDAALPKIVAGALERLDSEKPEDYRPYFLGGENALGLPQRSGYVLGYRIAAEAGKTRSLEQLADLQPAEVRKLIEAGLRRMQASKPTSPLSPAHGGEGQGEGAQHLWRPEADPYRLLVAPPAVVQHAEPASGFAPSNLSWHSFKPFVLSAVPPSNEVT
jgi:hypothetical protein